MPLYVAVRNPFVATVATKMALKNATQEQIDKFTQSLKDKGHDGVVMAFSDGHIELMAFDPAKVKSSIGNNGDFDPTNSDIRFARGGGMAGAATLWYPEKRLYDSATMGGVRRRGV
jgi:hypothetical protein